VDVVFHVAGVVRAPTVDVYDRVNAEGAGALARAAAALPKPPRRLVLVSSLAAGGPSSLRRPRTETDPDDPLGPYGASKLRGEILWKEAAGAVGWTILRPPAVYGPRDPGFRVLAQMAARGWVPPISRREQPASVVAVHDLVEAILVAAQSPKAVGKTYYVADPTITSWEEMGKMIARSLGRSARRIPVPRDLFPWVGILAGFFARIARKPNPLPRDRMRDLMAPAWTCDTSRIRGELGFTTRVTLEQGLAEMTSWYKDERWL
jgi:dihydroflavonol-4-reductase